MANIEVITQINDLLAADDVTIAKTALGVLGAVTTGNASIVNADISATAGINVSKLTSSSATAGFVLTSSGTAAAPTFQQATGGNLTSGPVTSSSGVSAIADAALSIAKTSGLQDALNAKQATLVSGTNIRTVNNNSLVGSGNVTITGSDVIDVTASPYNAVGDGRLIDTYLNTSGVATQGASMTSGLNIVTVTGGSFTAGNTPTGDVGKYICIQGVGTLPTGTIYASPAISKTIASASQASNVVTLVFAAAHGFTTGDVIDVAGITGSPSPNGRYTVTSIPLATTLTYTLSGSAGTYTVSSATATGGIVSNVALSTFGSFGAYPANATIDFEVESLGTANPPVGSANPAVGEIISAASQSSDLVTLTFASPHGFTTGDLVDVSGITGSTGTTPNGRFTITVTSVTQITYALVGSLGTYGVSTGLAKGVAIAGLNGLLRMTTNANGQAENLSIVNGGTLYANPKLAFPETGLIGTITGFNNSTQVTISRVAPSTFTLKPCFFGTNNTVAIQSAIDAAYNSTTIKTVYIPTGIFLCNVTSYNDIKLIGAGGGIGLANNLTFSNQDPSVRAKTNPTVLMPAVGYKPVIYIASGAGSLISRVCIHGAPSLMNNIGVQVGASYATGFVALGFLINQVNFSGFKYALAAARVADCMFENVSASYCGIIFYLTQPDENHYTDQTTINCCYGNYIKDYFLYCVGGKSVQMISCDYTNSGPIAKIKSGTRLTIIGMNMESSPISYPSNVVQADADLIEAIGGASVIINSLRLAPANNWTNGAVIKEDTNRTNAAAIISVLSSDAGLGGMYRTNSGKYPNLLPKGAVISRWNSGFTTKIMSEVSTRAYAGAGKMGRFKNWEEYFPTAPPYNRMVTAATQVSDVVSLTTSSPHKLVAGMQVVVEGIGYASGTNPNGTFLVATALTSTTLTYSLTGSAGSYTTNGRSFVTVEGLAFQNGFCLTNIGATNFLKPLINDNNGVGIASAQLFLKTAGSSNPGNTGVRLAQEYASIFNTEAWELKFDLQSQTLANYPLIRFGMYDLTSTSLTPSNGVGINIVNAGTTEPNIFLEFIVNGTPTTQDTGFKLGSSRRVLVLSKFGSQITLSLHSSAQTGYAPVAQYVWNQAVSNTNLYYSPSIYLGNSTTNFMEMLVNSIKYQELNTDLL